MLPILRGDKCAIAGAAFLLLGAQITHAYCQHQNGSMPEMHHAEGFSFGTPGDPAKADRVVNITMNDLSFTPNALTVRAGETVSFVVANKSAIEHDFTLGDAVAQMEHRGEMAEMFKDGSSHHHDMPNAVIVKPGETARLTWRFGGTGDVEFDCNVPGHAEAGMKGAITVTP
jgi:uncharacterized cupredoxin-like copper-binding protein